MERVAALFGAAAFGIFYWFNVPVLAEGVGDLAGGTAPSWAIWEGRVLAVALAGGWLVRRLPPGQGAEAAGRRLSHRWSSCRWRRWSRPRPRLWPARPPSPAERRKPIAGTPPVEVPDRRTGGRRMRYLHVTVMPEGRRVPVLPGQTVLEVAEEHDLGLVPGCRVGICGCDPIYVLEGADGLSAPDRGRARHRRCALRFPPERPHGVLGPRGRGRDDRAQGGRRAARAPRRMTPRRLMQRRRRSCCSRTPAGELC